LCASMIMRDNPLRKQSRQAEYVRLTALPRWAGLGENVR
jgi:hypothetical protein